MRCKFFLATRHASANKLIKHLQNSITELAIAFGSSFTIKEVPFDDIDMSFSGRDSAMLVIGDKNDARELSKKMGLFAQMQSYLGAANVSLLKSELLAKGTVLYPMDSSKENFASFTGFIQAQRAKPENIITAENVSPVIEKLLFAPDQLDDIICDYNAGLIVKTLATDISGTQRLQFKILMGNAGKIHFVPLEDGWRSEDAVSPYGMYFAVSDMLSRFNLEREAMCLKTANANVLKAGWRTEDCLLSSEEKLTATSEICALIDEQIQLAGELMQS